MFLCSVPPATATVIYGIAVNTSSVNGTAGMLDFQFNPGSGVQAAAVDISMFTSDGMLTGSPTTSGGASGNLTTTVHIDNSGGLNEYFQGFTFGNSFSFQILFSGPAIDMPDGTSTDTFGLALYKGNDFTMPILNDGSQGDFIVTISVNTDGSTTPTTSSSPLGLVTVQVVPEPATLALGGVMLFCMAGWRRFRRRRNHL